MPRPMRTRSASLVTLGALALGLLAWGASVPATAADDPRDIEIAQLKRRVLALRQQTVVDRVEIDRLRQEVAQLEETLAALDRTGRRAPEPAPTGPVTAPRRAIESSDLEVASVSPEPIVPADHTTAGSAVSDDELQAIYDDGYTLFHQKRYADAEARFAAYLDRSGASDLADNAQFWIGECRYARGDHAAALEAFTAVVERFPKGNKVPDAMVKAGKTLAAMGDETAARATYREVQSRFPGTAAAATAAELLEQLR